MSAQEEPVTKEYRGLKHTIKIGDQISNFIVDDISKKGNETVLIVRCANCNSTSILSPYRFVNGNHKSCSRCRNFYRKRKPKEPKIFKDPKECPICHEIHEGFRYLALHVSLSHKIKPEDFYVKYFMSDPNETICPTCNGKNTFKSIAQGYHKHCSLTCAANDPKQIQTSKNNLYIKEDFPAASSFKTGERAGSLTAIDVKIVDNHTVFICQCDCGGIYDYRPSDFRTNIRKNCRSCRLPDLEGKRFGRLIVIEPVWIKRPTKRNPENFQKHWLCQCDCGSTPIVVLTAGLKTGKSKSCGCLKKDLCIKRNILIGEISKGRWNSFKNNARSRNLTFDVTPEFAWNLYLKQDKKCALTGKPIDFKKIDRKHNISLDRIDSDKEYSEDNVQWTTVPINRFKNKYNQAEFIDMCKSVADYNS